LTTYQKQEQIQRFSELVYYLKKKKKKKKYKKIKKKEKKKEKPGRTRSIRVHLRAPLMSLAGRAGSDSTLASSFRNTPNTPSSTNMSF
jgi:hypothetical protein